MTISLDLYRGRAVAGSRVMYAINLWITGPRFPVGTDRIGRKPLVFDLSFHVDGSFPHNLLVSFTSSKAHHYQEEVAAAPLNEWRSVSLDLTRIIARGLRRFSLEPEGATICQLEFLIELKNAEASAMIDNLYLSY
jgi:hypothetical protein